MRRNSRMNRNGSKELNDKILLYTGFAVAGLAVVVFMVLMFTKNLSDEVEDDTISLEEMASYASNTTNNTNQNTQSASTDIGKSVNESKNTINSTANNSAQNGVATNTVSNTTTSNRTTNTSQSTSSIQNNTAEKEEVKELNFEKPVDGEIMREYAKDNLIYSETLDEWTTHMGIDIKADKATVVKAAEAGTVKTIKNDPRYGLTVVIEHDGGFQTVYANLLTSEFVVEGETVEKGQSIGTVGNTAVFEIADESHLHFEILKDSIQVDPSIYIK